MRDILIAKVETDPLIHYGGLLNTFSCQILLSLILFVLFIPFIKNGRYKNFLFFIFSILPILNVYYRNNHQFVGGVFLGHILFFLGILLSIYLTATNFNSEGRTKTDLRVSRKLLLSLMVIAFIIRAILAFGSRPTDSGIFSGAGAILYFNGSSMFRDYWGVVSIGSRYGPALYLAYLPFVPLAYFTKHLLWGDALTQWNSIADVPLAVATSYTGAVFYDALIVFVFVKSFKKFGPYSALLYLVNPLNSLVLSVNANELPQTAFFLLGIYLLKSPVSSALSFVFSSMMKLYPIVSAVPFALQYGVSKAKRFVWSGVVFTTLIFGYWLFEASLAPAELKTNPIRDIFLYQKDPGKYHSLWYFTDELIFKNFSTIVIVIIVIFVLYLIYRIIKGRKRDLSSSLSISILLLCVITLVNQSVHPGYYYFMQTLLYYLFFLKEEDNSA